MLLKKIARSVLPDRLLAAARTARDKPPSPRDVFSGIYRDGAWGTAHDPDDTFYSGDGSHDDRITTAYVDNVVAFLRTRPDKPNVVDLGCGDFSVGSRIRPFCNRYIACDVVPALIARNRKKYADLDVDFRQLDLITDPLPAGDIVFIRQVLQHLSNRQIAALIPKLRPRYRFLVLTEHLPASDRFTPNLDQAAGAGIRLGFGSGVVLTEAPFNLRALEEKRLCTVEGYGGVVSTMLYRLD